MQKMGDISDMAMKVDPCLLNIYKEQVPPRVHMEKAIQVQRLSQIPKAGRGLFAREDIKEGELIFAVDPIIITIMPAMKKEVCDFCFAIRNSSYPTVPISNEEKGLKLRGCKGCHEVYYCNEECQKAAWKSHHKSECLAISMLQRVTINDIEVLNICDIRGLVRLLRMWCDDEIGALEKHEFNCLTTNRGMKEKDGFFKAAMEVETDILADISGTRFPKERLKDLYCAMGNNQLAVILPVLKGSYSIALPERPTYIIAGSCLDPFAATMNHSCLSNSVWGFEGRRLQVRARKNINAGEELTISYTNTGRDYHQRNCELLQHYGFTCLCALCRKGFQMGGQLTPTGKLRDLVLGLIQVGKPTTEAEIKGVELAIVAMKEAGYGHDKYPMRPLHQMILSGFVKVRNYSMALKTALILYYFIEPTQTPPSCREERLETLHYITQLLECDLTFSREGDLSPSPELNLLRKYLYLHLRYKYIVNLKRCFGSGSNAVKFELQDFQKALQKLQGSAVKFLPITEAKEQERKKFVRSMNELLKMVDLPGRTGEELFWEEDAV